MELSPKSPLFRLGIAGLAALGVLGLDGCSLGTTEATCTGPTSQHIIQPNELVSGYVVKIGGPNLSLDQARAIEHVISQLNPDIASLNQIKMDETIILPSDCHF